MKSYGTQKTEFQLRALLLVITLATVVMGFIVGCDSEKPLPSPAAVSLKKRIQANLDHLSPELSKNLHKRNHQGVKGGLDRFYAELNGQGDGSHFFLVLLDNHGVTITSRAKSAVNGVQNYGNYQVVAKVIQKKKIFQSSLYLQGGRKVYIICAPLLNSGTTTGVLIIGIDSDYMNQAGISEREFMSQDYNTRNNGTR
jgi:hypothetical protein